MVVLSESIVLGSFSYQISVRQEFADGYYGRFFCAGCHTGGMTYELKPTAVDAMAHARELAERHHREFHSLT